MHSACSSDKWHTTHVLYHIQLNNTKCVSVVTICVNVLCVSVCVCVTLCVSVCVCAHGLASSKCEQTDSDSLGQEEKILVKLWWSLWIFQQQLVRRARESARTRARVCECAWIIQPWHEILKRTSALIWISGSRIHTQSHTVTLLQITSR